MICSFYTMKKNGNSNKISETYTDSEILFFHYENPQKRDILYFLNFIDITRLSRRI